MPSILVAALVSFLLAYTEFALAWMFIDSEENVTLAMVLADGARRASLLELGAHGRARLLMARPS